MEVHRNMGRGFQEYIYQRALDIELKKAGLRSSPEFDLPVYYKNDRIGLRRVDFLINDLICVEIKAVSSLEDVHLAQALNYLEASGKEVGLLINFGSASLQFKRIQIRDAIKTPPNPPHDPSNRGPICAFIPARYAATRFPAKLMQMLGSKTVIRHTYDNTLATGLFDDVYVVTDSDIIYNEITSNGGKAVMSKKAHESGSDRIAEAIVNLDVDIVVNVQGDEPFVKREPLEKLLRVFNGEEGKNIQVASLMQLMKEQQFIDDPNYVKVAVDKNMNSLMFSRSVIPYPRSKNDSTIYYEHIGVYAFRKQALLNFTSWEMTPLEKAEKIECLRYLENGIPLKMVVTDYMGVEIDTPEDLERAAALL
jgi:3-deoxy-manno-octulosonate cytidylyltransferase (CMP-KDO synthetase)